MFRTDLPSIISSINTVYTAIGICHARYVDCLLARSGWKFHPALTVDLSETCTVLYQNKLEKKCTLLAFIIRIVSYYILSPCGWFKTNRKILECNVNTEFGTPGKCI